MGAVSFRTDFAAVTVLLSLAAELQNRNFTADTTHLKSDNKIFEAKINLNRLHMK